MKRVWSDENKFGKWLEVEIAVCEAWAALGVIPRGAVPKIKMARINLKRMEKILKETHHDMRAWGMKHALCISDLPPPMSLIPPSACNWSRLLT
jgi:adenylosuccinate lyase